MLKVFAVRDVKADAYGALICVPTVGLAVRTFVEACADDRSPMAQYPEDYSLYELGEFEPNSGRLTGHALPTFISSAIEARGQKKIEVPVVKTEVAL